MHAPQAPLTPRHRTAAQRLMSRWADALRRRQERHAARQALARIARDYPTGGTK